MEGKKGKKQLCVGLLTTEDGFPLRIQAFKGNTPDSVTVSGQLHSFLNNSRDRVEALVENIRRSWRKRCDRNVENRCRQEENPQKYRHLKTELTDKNTDRYKYRINRTLDECGMGKYYSIETVDSETFDVIFRQDGFDKSLSVCGKYVICSNVSKEDMTAEQVRGKNKNLQKVEHAFRDLKSDSISLRPVFLRREQQTRGHVLLCMFAYSIIKEMENRLFPFLKKYNISTWFGLAHQPSLNNRRTQGAQLSLNDLTAELDNIKICELKIGTGTVSLMKPELNPLQKSILEALNIDPNKLMK